LLDELITIYAVSARQKNIQLQLTYDENLAEKYKGDAYRLRQILVNLIGNAIKFTEQGQVKVKICKIGEEESKDTLHFTIQDTGIGIDPEIVPNLFQPFVQADTSSTRKFGGTGLGLSICAKLVKLMGGEIGVEPAEEGGSLFWFTIALERSEEPGIKPSGSPPAMKQLILPLGEKEKSPCEVSRQLRRGIALLVVDDDQTNRIVMEGIFRFQDLTLDFASNGEIAVSMCKKKQYELIFMDCQMPVMDGFEATRKILAYYDHQPHVYVPPVVALTADATTATRKRCYDIGMVDYLVKPIDFKKMEQVISTWLPQLGIARLSKPDDSHAATHEVRSSGETKTSPASAINLEVLQRLEKHVGSIDRVIQVLVPTMQKRVEELVLATEEKRGTDVQKIAHTMKGSSAQIGAEELSALCARAEQAGKAGRIGQIESLLPQISKKVEDVILFFQEQLDNG